jgi:hypothetical protein
MTQFKKFSLSTIALLLLLTSCEKKLELYPPNKLTSQVVFSTPLGYDEAMAKVYLAISATGNQGPAGQGDVSGDEGFSDHFRGFFTMQELPTDEAIISWGDVGLPDFHTMQWSAPNGFTKQFYARAYFQITLINNFLKEAASVDGKGFPADDVTRIKFYVAEVRFLRAYQYWCLMDLFGNVPFATEVGLIPGQIDRAKLFQYVESELLAIEPLLLPARSSQAADKYGRADQGACWALLARMYLNAEVYTGTARWSDASTYSKKVIDAGYTLASDYRWLFAADNDQVARQEFIFTLNYDGTKTEGYGGTTYLVNASNGSENYSFKFVRAPGDTVVQRISYGGGGGWNGLKAPASLLGKFPNSGLTPGGLPDTSDRRAMFLSLYLGKTQNKKKDSIRSKSITITNIQAVDEGVRCWKYRNVTSTGKPGSDPQKSYSDADMPIFRLAEQYFIYAEAAVRGSGDVATAVQYMNNLRQRAYGDANHNITASDLKLPFILDERSRELYWEGHRRTDLIRFKLFTSGDYLWPFKGGEPNGKGVEDYRVLYPIPTNDLIANPGLKQNPGY